MRLMLSMLWEFIPFLLVYFWSNKALHCSKIMSLGFSLMVSAITSYFGAKYFNFYIIGKSSILEGEKAIGVSGIVFIIGIALVLSDLVTKRVLNSTTARK